MQSQGARLFALVPILALAACAREARADVPKPLPGGHVFDIEVVETEADSAAPTKKHYVLAISGDSGCAKLGTTAGTDQISVNACLRKDAEGKSTVDVDVTRQRAEAKTRIEGRVPFSVGTRALVGRTEENRRTVDIYLTAG